MFAIYWQMKYFVLPNIESLNFIILCVIYCLFRYLADGKSNTIAPVKYMQCRNRSLLFELIWIDLIDDTFFELHIYLSINSYQVQQSVCLAHTVQFFIHIANVDLIDKIIIFLPKLSWSKRTWRYCILYWIFS